MVLVYFIMLHLIIYRSMVAVQRTNSSAKMTAVLTPNSNAMVTTTAKMALMNPIAVC